MSNDAVGRLVAIVVGVGAIAFAIWLGMSIWDECREAGHSVLYCMRMVAR